MEICFILGLLLLLKTTPLFFSMILTLKTLFVDPIFLFLKEKIIGPYVLGTAYPELTKNAVVCVTETTTRAEIEKFAAALQHALTQPI